MLEDAAALRAVTIGDASVGKTCIVNKFIHDRYDPLEKSTVGAIYESWREYNDGRAVEIQIWDTAGQEQYRSIIPVYFRFAAAAIFVYDVTNRSSFEGLDGWWASFQQHNHGKVSLFLVANKVDLADFRSVALDEGMDWAHAHSCSYHETSARTGEGVKGLFAAVSAVLVTDVGEHKTEEQIPSPPGQEEQKKQCC